MRGERLLVKGRKMPLPNPELDTMVGVISWNVFYNCSVVNWAVQ
jgi:hypothetical protein